MGQMYEQKGKWRAAYQTYQIYRMRISQKRFFQMFVIGLEKQQKNCITCAALMHIIKSHMKLGIITRHNIRWQYMKSLSEGIIRKLQCFMRKWSGIFTESVQYENMQPQSWNIFLNYTSDREDYGLRRKKNMTEAKKCFVKAEHLEHITLEQMKFLYAFYGNEADEYLDLLIRRMPMNQIRINRQEAEWRQHAD